MANDSTSERLWSLTDVAVIVANGSPVIVRKIIYIPTTIDDDVEIQEYSKAGVLRDAIVLKANHTDYNPIAVDFGRMGRLLNGFKLATIDHGTVYIYIGQD